MALSATELQVIFGLLGKLPPKPRILMISYPDLLVTESCADFINLPVAWKDMPKRSDDTRKIWTEHGRGHLSESPMIDLKAALEHFGAKVVVSDVIQWGHVDTIIDLGSPISRIRQWKLGQFDLIIDPCTMCHCFDVATAFANVDRLLAPAGIVYHQAPASFSNHGFWSISPTTFFDWYQSRNYELGRGYRFAGEPRDKDGHVPKLKAVDPFTPSPTDAHTICIYAFRKPKDGRSTKVKYPVQRCYSSLSRELQFSDIISVPENCAA